MIIEFRCPNDDCPYVADAREVEDGAVLIDDADRYTWYGAELGATRVDPAAYVTQECEHCGASGEEIGRYTPRQLREEMEL